MPVSPWEDTPLAENALYDLERSARHSFLERGETREHRRTILRILTHYIEGGMCFPDLRLGYGQEKIHSILDKLDTCFTDFGCEESIAWAVATIDHYLVYHQARSQVIDGVQERVDTLRPREVKHRAGGAETVTKAQIDMVTDFDFRHFLLTCHSVRAERPGARFLNWSVDKATDITLRTRADIPDNELVITFMSAGHLTDSFLAPVSARNPLDAVWSMNPPLAPAGQAPRH